MNILARSTRNNIARTIPIHAYLIETGEFRWTSTIQACGDTENAKRILKVLKKMPEDRRAVWASRLDTEHAKMTCPVIRKEADLCKQFDEFCVACSKARACIKRNSFHCQSILKNRKRIDSGAR